MLRHFGLALATLLVLDAVWLGVLMTGFYYDKLSHLARTANGKLDPIWSIAAPVYPLIAAGLAVFVLARARSPLEALMLGAFFGAIVFGVYDLTNHATLRDWRTSMTIVDTGWGAFSCGAACWVAASFSQGW